MRRRIERAAALLRLGVSVSRACAEVGYTSLGSFSARFSELIGEAPSTYAARGHDQLRDASRCQQMAMLRPERNQSVLEK